MSWRGQKNSSIRLMDGTRTDERGIVRTGHEQWTIREKTQKLLGLDRRMKIGADYEEKKWVGRNTSLFSIK